MSKFEEVDFDYAEYGRKRQRLRKRLTACLVVLAATALVGMVLFWR